MSDKITIFSTFWGDYERLFNEYALKSVKPSIEKLNDAGVDIDFDVGADPIRILGLLDKTCNNPNHYVFFMPPDTIFSQWSLYNLYSEFRHDRANVAIPHMRINREQANINIPCGREEFNAQCLPILHYSAIYSENECVDNLWYKGIYRRERSFSHCLPTIYWCNFIPEDRPVFGFLQNNKYFWDNQWLEYCYEARRMRIVGSGEIAGCYEMTGKDENHAKLVRGQSQWHQNQKNRFTGCGLTCYVL